MRDRSRIILFMNKLNTQKRAQIIAALVEGNSINAIVRMTGAAKHTVLKLLEDVGCACAALHNRAVRNVRSARIQADEIWQFCYAKNKNVPEKLRGVEGIVDVWTWVALDADTKLAVAYRVGNRDAVTAYEFMQDVADRVANRIQLTTDGHRVYLDAVNGAFPFNNIDYAMLVKVYGAALESETRYSPPQCIGCEIKPVIGRPDPKHISTSFVERQNLNMRMAMRRFTRLTNGFSKKLANHRHAVALHFAYYNFCRIHMTLRVTPAMEAGLADHPWTLEELVELVDAEEALAA